MTPGHSRFRVYLDDIDPRLLYSQASHLSKLVERLNADTTILVSAILHKGSDRLPAHLCHPLVQLHILQDTLHSCGKSDNVLQLAKQHKRKQEGKQRRVVECEVLQDTQDSW